MKGNEIGDKACSVIGSNTTWVDLEGLSLSLNSIRVVGGEAITANTLWKKLTRLFLEDNRIGVKCITMISSNTTWVNFEELYLPWNNIGDEGGLVIITFFAPIFSSDF